MKDQPGEVYLIHFDRKIGNPDSKYGTARHYTGWTSDLDERLAEHAAGHGAKIMAAVRQAGISWHVARTWPGTRARERQLKTQGGASRRCPDCKTEKEQTMAGKPETTRESGKVTVGELAKGVAAGTWTRSQAAKAIADLEVIHWGARVDRPSPEIEDPDLEMEL